MLLSLLFGIITVIFVIVAPFVLKKSKRISPTKNIFENFIDQDHGYPWSWEAKRKKSYKEALAQRENDQKKQSYYHHQSPNRIFQPEENQRPKSIEQELESKEVYRFFDMALLDTIIPYPSQCNSHK